MGSVANSERARIEASISFEFWRQSVFFSSSLHTICTVKRVRISWLWQYLYTNYLSLCSEPADPVPFRDKYCTLYYSYQNQVTCKIFKMVNFFHMSTNYFFGIIRYVSLERYGLFVVFVFIVIIALLGWYLCARQRGGCLDWNGKQNDAETTQNNNMGTNQACSYEPPPTSSSFYHTTKTQNSIHYPNSKTAY